MSDSHPPVPEQAPVSPPGEQPLPPGSAPEYLEAGGGGPLPPVPPTPTSGGGRRRGLVIGATIAGLAVVGAGAWAATQFFATGAQPAEALPAGTLGYASVDLDPSGSQKIEALRTLNKFPAFKDEVGINADDDLREKLFDSLDLPADCKIFYAEDIEPWLGSRFAMAAVDTGDGKATPVAVIQVTDADEADAGLKKLQACEPADSGSGSGGWVIDGDWAVVAETQDQAQAVADLTAQGTLADDQTFQELTAAAGDSGIASFYVAPDAKKYLGKAASDAEGMFGPMAGFSGDTDVVPPADDMTKAFDEFGGLAVTVRFDSGALEVEGAGDGGVDLAKILATGRGGDVVETLPPATAAAIGVGFDQGWLTQLVGQVASRSGDGTTADELFADASDATGLDLPEDAEALVGDSAALVFGSDFDPEAFFNSGDAADLPLAVKAKGDDKAAIAALEKVLAQHPDASKYLGLDSDAGYFVIGPDTEYRTAILGHGDLGNDEVYRDVIRESDKASVVVFVNFNTGDDWLVKLAGDDPTVAENVRPLAGFGVDVWQDDDLTHGVLRITTD